VPLFIIFYHFLMSLINHSLANFIAKRNNVKFSFEFFPPKNEEMEQKLWQSINSLQHLNPSFVSVTYGAGGSTRERTHQTIQKILTQTALKPASHLTCIAASKQEIAEILYNYWQIGVRHIVALRGDMPASSPNYQLHQDGYQYASDLVTGIKDLTKYGIDFDISVAGYPQKHPQASSLEQDIYYLKQKVDAGANRIITQFFFEAEDFLRFVDLCHKNKIFVPIIPGILPVSNFAQVQHFAKMCDITIPSWMFELFNNLDNHKETRQLIAAVVATELCRILHNYGISEFHFYTLNRADLTLAICHLLGGNIS
jgi:methylenetetrahydrofolate reductase (NADPH)